MAKVNTKAYGPRVRTIGNAQYHKDSNGYVHTFNKRTGEHINTSYDTWGRYNPPAKGERASSFSRTGGKTSNSNP